MGNTCYLNSVVQVLMSDHKLISELIGRTIECPNSVMPATSELAGFARHRFLQALPALRQAVGYSNPDFLTNRMQDAHEFFLACLAVLDSECEVSSSSNGGYRAARDFGDYMSPDLLGYSLTQETVFQCMGCGIRSDLKEESLIGLSLAIPVKQCRRTERMMYPDSDLATLFNNYFEPEEIERRCPRPGCGCDRATAHTIISRYPRSLMFYIKRFTADLQKITARVTIPESLDLVSISTDRAGATTETRYFYKLTAVLRHQSQSVQKGHYVTDVKEVDGSWTCCNDSDVYTLTNASEMHDTEGYMCMYSFSHLSSRRS